MDRFGQEENASYYGFVERKNLHACWVGWLVLELAARLHLPLFMPSRFFLMLNQRSRPFESVLDHEVNNPFMPRHRQAAYYRPTHLHSFHHRGILKQSHPDDDG